MHRREFIKTIAAAGAMTLLNARGTLAGEAIASPGYFGLHQFIETHPNAVFIKHTNVTSVRCHWLEDWIADKSR